jgi:DNA replication licensing factor MCM2
MPSEDDSPRPRQRRRIASDSEDDGDNNDDDNNSAAAPAVGNAGAAGASPAASATGTPTRESRLARIERRAAQRRRQRELKEEVDGLRLAGEDDDYRNVEDEEVKSDDDGGGAADDEVDNADVDALLAAEEDDGEDLLDNAERDYQRIEALDTYGTEGMDDRDYDNMDTDARQAAEATLSRRDREHGGRNDGFYGMLDNMEEEEDEEARQARRGNFARRVEDDVEEEEDETDEEDLDGDDQVNLEAFDVPLREWIAQDRTRREIQRKFRAFLRHYTGEAEDENTRRRRGNGIYEQKIRAMCASNLSTLQVSYLHLMDLEPVLAYWLADAPKDMLLVLNEAATRHTLMLFPNYNAIKSEIHVRISDVPILDSLRDLRRSHLDCFVKVHGVVTRRSAVYPQLQLAYYTCMSCKNTQGPFRVEGVGSDLAAAQAPDSCQECEIPHFRLHATMSQYRNVQRVNLQETPGSVPPGRVPRTKEVLLTDDLIDIARPGEEVEVTGVFEHTFDSSLTIKSGFPVFGTFILANHIRKREDDSSASNLSENDVRRILELARDPKIGERIVQSIAPSIFGHDQCKMALAMSLFGAVAKNVDDKHRIRGDVNVLLLGDPGTAKSQLLKYAEHTAPRAVYSTGKGASAVGLTASVHKDPITREWTLEGGALVLADKGVCLIDEFDKMNEQDRTSIHEAMEQQTISVSKAGIVTSLQARCAVIAAANPIGGRYDSSNNLADNVELTDPILQRFDILCVLQDIVDPVADERLAQFVTSSHMRSTPTRDLAADKGSSNPAAATQADRPGLIPQDLLRKYIQYARTNVRPVLRGNTFDQEKVASLYVALRRESAASGGVPIAVRHVESIMRMSEAHAKMHLRDYVRDDDMDAAIRMMLESFIVAQKFSVRRALRRSFAKFISSGEDRAHLLLHILQDMFRKEQMYQVIRLRQRNQSEGMLETLDVPLDELESRARERRIYDVSEFCTSEAFQEAGYVFDDRRRVISRSVAA